MKVETSNDIIEEGEMLLLWWALGDRVCPPGVRTEKSCKSRVSVCVLFTSLFKFAALVMKSLFCFGFCARSDGRVCFFFSIRLCPDNLFRSVPLVRADEATVEVQDQVLDSMDNG